MTTLELTKNCDSCKYVKYSADGGSTRCKRKECEFCPVGKVKYFVVYLYAYQENKIIPTENGNDYGYYASEYKFSEEPFPVCDYEVTKRTKRYKSRKRAETAAEKYLHRYNYAVKTEVRAAYEDEPEGNN